MDNPYTPPGASTAARKGRESPWTLDLAVRVAIVLLSAVPFMAYAGLLMLGRAALEDAIRSGAVRPLAMAMTIAFNATLLAGGVLLLFSRRAALWCFIAYLFYALFILFMGATPGMAALSLLFLAGCILYCRRLDRAGRLR